MRRRTYRSNALVASLFTLTALAAITPSWAQNELPAPPTVSVPVQTGIPQIVIGQTVLTLLDKTRQPYRDPADNYVCVPPESVASALGTMFAVDEDAKTATFTNPVSGLSVTIALRVPPRGGDARGAFVAITPLAERLGGKCEYNAATNILHIRSVLTLVEMVGSELRVTGTLPLTPRIVRINGGKTVAFDFPGTEVGLLPKNLTAVGAGVKKARTGQFDSDTARVVLDLTDTRPYVWIASAMPSGVAVLSSAPGASVASGGVTRGESVVSAPNQVNTAPPYAPASPVTVAVGANGMPLPRPAVKPLPRPAVPTVLRGVRFVNVSDTQARIIVDAPNAPAVKTLLTRARLTLDVQNGVFGPGTQTTLPEASHPLLRGVQSVNTSATTAQLLIDLSRAVNFTVRLNPKGGFVVDITLPKGAGGRIAGKLIVVDPGHGGDDHGAPGVNGAKEKNVALAIAQKLAMELRDRGANVILTRDSDSFVTLAERSEIANRAGADLFVAIHADSAGARADGSNTYYHLSDPSGRTLATCVADRIATMGGIRSRGPRSDGTIWANSGFSVLRRTKAVSILCETGYMSNRHDASLLVQSDMQARIARNIASGIQDYVEGNVSASADMPFAAPGVALVPDGFGSPTVAEQPKK